MVYITIRNLEDDLKRGRAWVLDGGRDAGHLMRHVVTEPVPQHNLLAVVCPHMEPLGGVKLDLPLRELMREPPCFAGECA